MEVKMKKKLEKLKSDKRNYYPIASVQINAPLALIQISLASQINLLESLLGLSESKFPLTK